MQVKGTRMHRVRAVAGMLDVSVATIYRAIESGQLEAYKLGTGKGALRIPEPSLAAYLDQCGQAARGGLEPADALHTAPGGMAGRGAEL